VKQFSCGDVVPGCQAVFTAPTDEMILSQVADHAAEDHGLDEVKPELVGAVVANIRQVA
jgi:predicted small metal-binding protein